MNTLNFLDANVWLALLWGRHVHSEKARAWFERSADEQFFFCRFTQITVLRLVTTKEIMGKDAQNRTETWNLWDKIWADHRIAFLPEQDGWKRGSRHLSPLPAPSPKVGQDAFFPASAPVRGEK